MIKTVKKEEGHEILFQPWANVQMKEIDHELREVYNKIQLPTIRCKLIMAHYCPICKNLIQAAFLTDKEVDPRPYEELNTVFKDSNGKLKVIRTGANSRFKSKYETTLVKRGDAISAQLIRLKEHFEVPDGEGASICNYRAFFSFRPDVAFQYVLLNASNHNLDPSHYNITPKVLDYVEKECDEDNYTRGDYRRIYDIVDGKSTIWLVRHGAYDWVLGRALAKSYKEKIA